MKNATTISNLKKKIKQYIDEADDRVLNIFNAIIDKENEHLAWDDPVENILKKRLKYHIENPSDGKSWDKLKIH